MVINSAIRDGVVCRVRSLGSRMNGWREVDGLAGVGSITQLVTEGQLVL